MKKDIEEIFDYNDKLEPKVGRPKLADDNLKKKSVKIICISLIFALVFFLLGYGIMIGFKNNNLSGAATNLKNKASENVTISEIKPLINNVTIKAGTAKKIYLTIKPPKASNKKIKYKSLNKKIAKVSSSGKVTGISEGKTTVVASTTDGSNLSVKFNIKVVKDISGVCKFTRLNKHGNDVEYEINCDNAVIKEVQYKVGGTFKTLTSKKLYGTVNLGEQEIKRNVIFKVVYYPNNSKVAKYKTKVLKTNTTTKAKVTGNCKLELSNVKDSSIRYNVTCENASIDKIAYKIGNGSYIGIEESSLSSTILYEKSDVTRVIYFNVEYTVDGNAKKKTITKSRVIPAFQETTTTTTTTTTVIKEEGNEERN